MKFIIYSSLLGVLWAAGLCSTSLYADTELENEDLIRIIHVLESLKPLINEAERQQDKNTRVQFQYNFLRQDLEKIKTGINKKLNPITIEPRIVTPVEGDYLSFKAKR